MKKFKCHLSLLLALTLWFSAPSAAVLAADTTYALQGTASDTTYALQGTASDTTYALQGTALDTQAEVEDTAGEVSAEPTTEETTAEDSVNASDAGSAGTTADESAETANEGLTEEGLTEDGLTGDGLTEDGLTEEEEDVTGEDLTGEEEGLIEEDLAEQEQSSQNTAALTGEKDGESTLVTLTNSYPRARFEATARYDASVYPEVRTLSSREVSSEEVEPIEEEVRQVVDGYENWEVDDVRSVRAFFTILYDSEEHIVTSAASSPVEYTFTFPEEYMPFGDLSAEQTYHVYEPTIDGPVLMEDAVIDAEGRTISITRENAKPYEFVLVILSKAEPDTTPSFQDCQSAIQYVREQAVQRVNNIEICVPDEVYQQLDTVDAMDVLQHTGNPVEGDYIANNIGYKSVSATQSADGSWAVSYYFAFWDTYEETQAVDAEAASLVSELDLTNTGKSDYDKIEAIYDYITSHVSYAHEALSTENPAPSVFSAYGSFIDHHCVCQGYALMFYRLALEAGIDSRIITGTVTNNEGNSEGHAWNIVKLEDKYYLLDTTWDAGKSEYSYFLCGRLDFGHANEDDQFHTIAGFSDAYPVFDAKYGFKLTSLGSAPNFSLITTDNKVISTRAENGRAKAIIFFGDKCVFSTALLHEIAEKEYPGVDIIAADYFGTRTNSLIGSVLPAIIPGVYTCCTTNYEAMQRMEEITGIHENGLSSPTLFLINKNNQIVYAHHGLDNEFQYILEHWLVDPEAPAYQEDTTDYGNFQAMGACGNKAIWRYYKNGTLRISGSGSIWNEGVYGWFQDPEDAYYFGQGDQIQAIYKKDVKRIIIEDGITSIGHYIFCGFHNLKSIEIPASVTKFGSRYEEVCDDFVIIYGYGNSAAKTYANKYGNQYVDLNTANIHIDYYSGANSGAGTTAETDSFVPIDNEPDVFTLLTTDNQEIKTKAENGRGKVFVFYGFMYGKEIPDNFFTQLEQTEIANADVVLVPVGNNCRVLREAKNQIGSMYPSSFPGVYCISSNNNVFFEYLQDLYDLAYTATVIIDGNSNIVYVEDGIPENLPELANSLVNTLGNSSGSEPVIDYGNFTKIGSCGNKAVWRFYSDGTLHISGKGALWDNVTDRTMIGWINTAQEDVDFVIDSIRYSNVRRVVIDSGITYIGGLMFEPMKNLKTVEIPSSVASIPSLYYPAFSSDFENLTIYGTENSYAHTYAKKYGYKFLDPYHVMVTTPISVVVGKTKSLKAVGLGKLTYTSSNPKVATVSSTGVVKGIKQGTVTITVKAAGNSRYPAVSKKVTVTVYKFAAPTISKLERVNGGVKITWNPVDGATKYRVLYKTGTGKWTKAGDATGNTLTWKGASSGNAYTFAVRVLSSSGTYISDYSGSKSITYIAVPSITGVKNTKAKTATVTWKKIAGVTGYQIQYATNKDFKSAKSVNVKGIDTLTKDIGSLTKGKTYYIRIRSYKTVSGTNAYSAWGGTRTLAITK